jgi:EAL domain-containing protein (putative c-di-GMP-specific phosphodiesterase class I)
MTTIAEGVEELRQADILQVEGCDEVQGYYFGRPMNTDGIDAMTVSHRCQPARLHRMPRSA